MIANDCTAIYTSVVLDFVDVVIYDKLACPSVLSNDAMTCDFVGKMITI